MAMLASSGRGLKRLLSASPSLGSHVHMHHGRVVLGRTASTGSGTTTAGAGANANTNTASGGAAAAESTRVQELLGYVRRSLAQHQHTSEHAMAPGARTTAVDLARFMIGSVITIPLAGWVGMYTYDYIYRVENCVKQLLEHEAFFNKGGVVSAEPPKHSTRGPIDPPPPPIPNFPT